MLTSRTFAEMRGSAAIGRAEAFRRAMLAVMGDDARPMDAHPSRWAPFVVVGEGAAVRPPTAKGVASKVTRQGRTMVISVPASQQRDASR